MQSAEEFAANMHAPMLSCDREDLIRERDAEVRADERAKVLAEFTEERATSWETGEVDYYRLVGPWRLDES